MIAFTILLTFAACSFTRAINCPIPENLQLKEIDYDKLLGNWIMLANKPEWDEWCKNASVDNIENYGLRIHEEYYKSQLHFWQRRVTKDFDIVKHLEPSPILELKDKAWYSYNTLKLLVIAADYDRYIVLYRCFKKFFFISEFVEIWGRRDMKLTPQKIPRKIKDALAKFQISSLDLKYRTPEDCWLE
ncbi:uncharacterized protein [Halyomorpha halys]|uniref:uncharacterized protein n=1 Tax=Halyomorpha halys TaxID=286706 RepID=UPI0034D24FDF